MICGDPQLFALESEISEAYERRSLMALGFFLIHLNGRAFGVRAKDATLLSAAFDGVARRIAERGKHRFPAVSASSASELATGYSRAGYVQHDAGERFLGMLDSEFNQALHSKNIVWAPDGEEGFDDGSCVLHLDVDDTVRLVGFSRAENPIFDPHSLRELYLPGDLFYQILKDWKEHFEREWNLLPKLVA